ncbi:hypothetical protein Tco_1164564 [Tanacetum coccineum]
MSSTTISSLLSSLFPHLQQLTPIPTPTTTEATTSTTVVSESKTLAAFHQRINNLEKDVKEPMTVDQYATLLLTIKFEVPNAIKEYLGTSLDDALYKVLKKHDVDIIKEYSIPAKISTLEDEDAMDEGVADKVKKRKQDDADKDEDTSAGSDQGLKKWKTSKDIELSKKAKKSIDFRPPQTWISKIAQVEKPPLSFDELMRTCKIRVELEYNFEECYKSLTDRLDWNNPKGKEYPFYLSKPLPLIMVQGRQVVPVDYFINNDLEYLREGSSSKKYTTSTTKTKAAKYDILGIKDMVPS